MKLVRLALCILSLALGSLSALAEPQDHAVQASPFEALRWEDDQPQVRVADVWYRPVAIDGVDVVKIVEACERRWPGQLRKRFSEDLMEAMDLVGSNPGHEVTLKLVRLADGEEVVLEGVPNTSENRRALWGANNDVPTWKPELSADEARADLRAFEDGLRERFAYLELRDVAWQRELEGLAAEFSEPVSSVRLADALHRLLMKFGDGHAGVQAFGYPLGERGPFLPFLIADSARGAVAFSEGRSSFLDPEHPFITSIAGVPLDELVAALQPYVAAGSPQLVRRRALGLLRDAALWYPLVKGTDAEPPAILPFELAGADGADARELTLVLTSDKPSYRSWPRERSSLLEGSIGYLRIPRMDEQAVREVHRQMEAFRDTRGLVVDVRGNGGGSREALLALGGYLIGPDQPPVVGNVAAYRLAAEFGDDHLDARTMYRADHAGWTEAQRDAIERASASFEPEWKLPDGFSAWHYLVLDRTGRDGEFHYDRPVVVLSDAGCFSATDIFLGALELLPNVTLVGTASSGGSARSQGFRLPHSGIEVRCASMASFRPDGRLYDGRGIEVDVEVLPAPDFHVHGGRDAALEAALEILGRR